MFYCIGSLGSLEVKVPTVLLKRTKFFGGASGKNTGNVELFWIVGKVVMNIIVDAISVFQVFCLG